MLAPGSTPRTRRPITAPSASATRNAAIRRTKDGFRYRRNAAPAKSARVAERVPRRAAAMASSPAIVPRTPRRALPPSTLNQVDDRRGNHHRAHEPSEQRGPIPCPTQRASTREDLQVEGGGARDDRADRPKGHWIGSHRRIVRHDEAQGGRPRREELRRREADADAGGEAENGEHDGVREVPLEGHVHGGGAQASHSDRDRRGGRCESEAEALDMEGRRGRW